MIIEEYKAKSLVKKSYPSPFGWFDYTLNPYQGCWHDCKYCDGKSERYHMHSDFGNRIRVKSNAVELLKSFFEKNARLANRQVCIESSMNENNNRTKAPYTIFVGGGVCDVYQPAEKKVRIMRSILQTAYDYGVPVILLTKNVLALDDLDLLKKINKETYACVNFTITLGDDSIQRVFEPRASSSSERFEAIRKFREEGIDAGVFFFPILPFIGDTDENMSYIFRKSREVQASYVYSGSLTLTLGNNKNEFFSTLREYDPKILSKYEILYGNNDKYGNMDYKVMKKLKLPRPEIKAYKYLYENNLRYSAKRYIPHGRIVSNLRISELLMCIAYVKGTVMGSWQEAWTINKAAYYIENYKRDIFELSREELLSLPISQIAYECMIDYFINGCSKLLTDLEAKAYEEVCRKLETYK